MSAQMWKDQSHGSVPAPMMRQSAALPDVTAENRLSTVEPMTAAMLFMIGTDRSPSDTDALVQAALFRSSARKLPRVSVVIPTRLRAVPLMRCLHALVKQDFAHDDYEIIVVDEDGGDAATQRVVKAIARRCGGAPAVQYLIGDNPKGPAAARNRGWQYARGSVIAFTTDDALPARDWLRQGLNTLTPNLAAVSGVVQIVPEWPIRTSGRDQPPETVGPARTQFSSANCFVQRRALMAVGGFDERFCEAWREDADLLFRLMGRFGGERRIGNGSSARVTRVQPADSLINVLSGQRRLQFDTLLYKKHPTLYRTHIGRTSCADQYAIVAALLAAAITAAEGIAAAAAAFVALWALLTLRVFVQSIDRRHATLPRLAERFTAALAVPPLAVFWRCFSALRYRVLPL